VVRSRRILYGVGMLIAAYIMATLGESFWVTPEDRSRLLPPRPTVVWDELIACFLAVAGALLLISCITPLETKLPPKN